MSGLGAMNLSPSARINTPRVIVKVGLPDGYDQGVENFRQEYERAARAAG